MTDISTEAVKAFVDGWAQGRSYNSQMLRDMLTALAAERDALKLANGKLDNVRLAADFLFDHGLMQWLCSLSAGGARAHEARTRLDNLHQQLAAVREAAVSVKLSVIEEPK
jgi:hypothetical protein